MIRRSMVCCGVIGWCIGSGEDRERKGSKDRADTFTEHFFDDDDDVDEVYDDC